MDIHRSSDNTPLGMMVRCASRKYTHAMKYIQHIWLMGKCQLLYHENLQVLILPGAPRSPPANSGGGGRRRPGTPMSAPSPIFELKYV